METLISDRSLETFLELEFGPGPNDATPLGDIAASLVSLDELLRDLASIAAYPSDAEFRSIEVVAIEMRRPLKVKLSLIAISPDAVKAFQEICRDIIVQRERRGQHPVTLGNVQTVLELRGSLGHARLTENEAKRIYGHVVALHNAEVPLKRVEVKTE